MTLTLTIEGASRLDNGAPAELVLNRRGAIVGRAATCDWALPDPSRHLSSRHFEIRFDGRSYLLIDQSTNGTMLAGSGRRLDAPHTVADGDRFQAGPYVIRARLTGEAIRASQESTPTPPAWRGWDDGAPSSSTPDPAGGWAAAPHGGWDAPPQRSGGGGGWDAPPQRSGGGGGWDAPPQRSGGGGGWEPQTGPSIARPEAHRPAAGWSDRPAPAAHGGWAPDAAMAPAPVASAWEAQIPAPDPASGWSSAAPDRPTAPSPDDLWGRIAEGNVVDWARGGFGQPVAPTGDPLGLAPSPAAASLPAEAPRPPIPAPGPAPTPPPGPPPSPAHSPASQADPAAFLGALGIDTARISNPEDALTRAAPLLRQLIAGLVVMLEARARAKSQLGAEATAYNPEGHNPLKFTRNPEDAVLMLLGAPQPGFMDGEAAVQDAFNDLQSHQVATLKAMQGALRTTLERFSPAAIRARASAAGVFERIVPGARDAALWQAYEREFGGVAQGSDEAFLDMFAKEFRQAYNTESRRQRP